jgi:hypothetical protein
MRHVRDVMRLKSAGMPTREIARRVGTAPSTVRLTIRRFEAAGLTWHLPDDMTDAVLEARLFASAGAGSWRPAGPAAPCRAGLGGGASRAQAQAHCRSCGGRSTSQASPAGIAIRIMLRPDLCCRRRSEPRI